MAEKNEQSDPRSSPAAAIEPLIAAEGLTKIYGSGDTAVHALDGVTFTVAPGELLAIMGPSGCGKSTLLNMIGALDQPTEGTICVAGEDLAQLKNVDRFRARTVGFVFQLHNLLPTLTAAENVEVPMYGQPVSARDRRERARHLLDLVGLVERGDHLPSQLSGGQRQRIAVARALANDPALLLADEPTGSLDSQSGQEILELMQALNQDHGMTIAIVTHDRQVAQATHRILRMSDGRIIDDHRLLDPLEEDLHMLAASKLGQAILDPDDEPLPYISDEEERIMRGILKRINNVGSAPADLGGDGVSVEESAN